MQTSYFKKLLFYLLPLLFFFSLSIAQDSNTDIKYVGSINSKKFHYPSCRWAKKIYPENLVTFVSREEATKAGRIPCKVCKP